MSSDDISQLFASYNKPSLTIATRESPLALWQANHVKALIEDLAKCAGVEFSVKLLGITTQGDKILGTPLTKVGGKGLFVKELEQALLDGRADIAVHSAKDIPMELPLGLAIHSVCEREESRDALLLSLDLRKVVGQRIKAQVTPQNAKGGEVVFPQLPPKAVVGTSSLRRKCQMQALRPDLQFKDLRGNIHTRIRKLDEGQYNAIVLASAGLLRMDMSSRIDEYIESKHLLPAASQGILAIEFREDDSFSARLAKQFSDEKTQLTMLCERAMNRRLEGGCQIPIAGYATIKDDELSLEGRVFSQFSDQSVVVVEQVVLSDSRENNQQLAESLGQQVAENLIAAGASDLLDL